MSNIDNERIYFKNLDLLRFIAAYSIVLLHIFFGWKVHFGQPAFIAGSMSPDTLTHVETVVENLSFGVDVFFIISGFLITYLLLSEHQRTGKVDVMKFYIRRAFRIWPLYFFMLLVAPVLSYCYREQSPSFLYHFFFCGNYDIINNGGKSVATDHLWSICIEEHFYLICPLLVAFIPVKRLPIALVGIVVVTILFRGLVSTFHGNYGGIMYLHTLSRIDTLAIGSLFGYMYFHKMIKFNHSTPLRLMIYGVFIFLFIGGSVVQSIGFFNASIKKYAFVLIGAYWIGNFLFNPKALFRVQKPNILHQFGKVSYGIYMFNTVIIYLILKTYSKLGYQNYFLYVVLVHVILGVLCYLSYRYFEKPFLALKEKYSVVKSGGVITVPEADLQPAPGAIPVTAKDE
jgi:peptidoglycan/LPS O-acetylase OafA/YrhL